MLSSGRSSSRSARSWAKIRSSTWQPLRQAQDKIIPYIAAPAHRPSDHPALKQIDHRCDVEAASRDSESSAQPPQGAQDDKGEQAAGRPESNKPCPATCSQSGAANEPASSADRIGAEVIPAANFVMMKPPGHVKDPHRGSFGRSKKGAQRSFGEGGCRQPSGECGNRKRGDCWAGQRSGQPDHSIPRSRAIARRPGRGIQLRPSAVRTLDLRPVEP